MKMFSETYSFKESKAFYEDVTISIGLLLEGIEDSWKVRGEEMIEHRERQARLDSLEKACKIKFHSLVNSQTPMLTIGAARAAFDQDKETAEWSREVRSICEEMMVLRKRTRSAESRKFREWAVVAQVNSHLPIKRPLI
jgi:hypothetical protein